jgi:hypothetical protein
VDSLLSILKRPARLGDSKTIISRRDVEIRMDLEPMCTAQCVSVVIINGLAAILFMIRYVLFGVAMIRTGTLPRWSGVLVAVGAPGPFAGFRRAQLVSTAAWPIATSPARLDRRLADRDLGQCESWRRPRLARPSAVAHRPLRMCLWQISQHEHEHRIFGESRRETATPDLTAYGRSSSARLPHSPLSFSWWLWS